MRYPLLIPFHGPSMHTSSFDLERISRSASRRYATSWLSREDLQQEAMLSMLELLQANPIVTEQQLVDRAYGRCRHLFHRERRVQRILEPLITDIPSTQTPPHLGFDDLRNLIWQKLSRPLAEILDRHYWQGQTLAEIGVLMSTTRRVAERYLQLARRKLRQLLDGK